MTEAVLDPPLARPRPASLKADAVQGVKWSAAGQAARIGVGLVATSVLAYLLGPQEFGLVGMAGVVVGFVTLCKDLGTGAAVVQKQRPTDVELATIHWLNVAVGALGALVLLALAPLCAHFFREPRLFPLVATLGVALLVSGPGVVAQSLLQKRLDFRALALAETVSTSAGAVAGITLALLGAGAWSLVVQAITMQAAATWLNLRASRYVPLRVFRAGTLRSVLRFSFGLTTFNVFNFCARNADQVLIGRVLGAADLGLYALAYRLVLQPLGSVHAIVGRVMFPLYSRIQEDDARLAAAFLRVLGVIAFLLLPALAGLGAIATPLVEALFGPSWAPTAPLMTLLAGVAGAQTVVGVAGLLYQCKGRTDWMGRWGIVSSVIAVAGFGCGLAGGARGVALAFLCVSLLLAVPGVMLPCRLVGIRLREIGATIARPLAGSLLLALALTWLEPRLSGLAPGLRTATLIGAGVALYTLYALLGDRARLREVLHLCRGVRP